MKATTKLLIVASILIAGAAIYYLSTKESWSKTYMGSEKKPYDTYIIHELLTTKFKSKSIHEYKSTADSALREFYQSNLNYVFIGDRMYLDSAAEAGLLMFVAQGNIAFISADFFPEFINKFQLTKDTTYRDSLNEEYYIDQFPFLIGSSIKIKLDNEKDTLNFSSVMDDKIIADSYSYLQPDYGFNEKVKILGRYNNNLINFFSYEYGKGKFLLHTTPQTFTNYALSNEENLTYADFVFSQLDTTKGIFWDDYSKIYHFKHNKQNTNQEEESPLRYILSQTGLRYAWYLSLAFLTLYVIFVGKRRQRAIPVHEKIQNTSLEFIKTVGKLYYNERDHRSICMHKMKLYNNFLRARYSINANAINDELKERISIVSGVGPEMVNTIYSNYFWIEKQIDISDNELVEFISAINNFYKQCK